MTRKEEEEEEDKDVFCDDTYTKGPLYFKTNILFVQIKLIY